MFSGSGGAVVIELDIVLDHFGVFWQLCDRVHGPGDETPLKQFPPKEMCMPALWSCHRRGVVGAGADPTSRHFPLRILG